MKLTTLLLSLITITGYAQNFEGRITYLNSFKSKSDKITDEQITSMMGSKEEYSIKGGNYKSLYNGTLIKKQLYRSAENRLYALISTSDTFYWEDGSKNKHPARRYEIIKNKETILGLMCDELIIYTKVGSTCYFYNAKYGIDPELFNNHTNENWYYSISKTKALPLKMILENEDLIVTSVAIEVTPDEIDDSAFELKDKDKVAKSRW